MATGAGEDAPVEPWRQVEEKVMEEKVVEEKVVEGKVMEEKVVEEKVVEEKVVKEVVEEKVVVEEEEEEKEGEGVEGAEGPQPTEALATGPGGDEAEAGEGEDPAGVDGRLEATRRKRREEAVASKFRSPRGSPASAASPRAKRPRDVSALDSFFTNGPRLQPASPDVPRRSSAP